MWQHPHPVAMMRALRAVVHENATPAQAMDVFNAVKSGKGK